MSFIKNHPYLSCTGLAVASNAVLGGLTEGLTNAVVRYVHSYTGSVCIETNSQKSAVSFLFGSLIGTIATTIPAIAVTLVDRVVHQNLFDNKPLQYGLVATESILGSACIYGASDSQATLSKGFFTAISDTSYTKALFITTLIQSLGFKYILDSAAEQNEVDNSDLIQDDSLAVENFSEESQVF